ncbi:hypothetical protein F5Y04DRAFT_246906 [Hypomontagnella monticulosa]|nr:hypothetical protein F5Y04DRAFT_246906 [Hypomontagnella monticulosa]
MFLGLLFTGVSALPITLARLPEYSISSFAALWSPTSDHGNLFYIQSGRIYIEHRLFHRIHRIIDCKAYLGRRKKLASRPRHTRRFPICSHMPWPEVPTHKPDRR